MSSEYHIHPHTKTSSVAHFMCHGISSKILVKTREMKNSHRNFIYFLATIYLSELTIIVLLGHSRLLVELKKCGRAIMWTKRISNFFSCSIQTRESRYNLDSSWVERMWKSFKFQVVCGVKTMEKNAIYLLIWEMRLTEIQRQENSDFRLFIEPPRCALKFIQPQRMQFIQS